MSIKFVEEENKEENYSVINRKKIFKPEDFSELDNKSSNKELNAFFEEFNIDEAGQEKLKNEWASINNIKGIIKDNKALTSSIKAKLENELKSFNFEIEVGDEQIFKKAVRQIYKKPVKKINYEMYKQAKEELKNIQLAKVNKEIE